MMDRLMTKAVIAVLENDPWLALMLDDCLTAAGYDVRLWHPSDPPYAFVRRVRPDMILMDLWLQQRDAGLEMLAQLRGDVDGPRLPVIICSGDMMTLETQAMLLHAQKCGVLTKPFKLADLLTLTRTCLADARIQ